MVNNITRADLPKVDLILCRDCLTLYQQNNAAGAAQFWHPGSTYPMTTSHPLLMENAETLTGRFRLFETAMTTLRFTSTADARSELRRSFFRVRCTRSPEATGNLIEGSGLKTRAIGLRSSKFVFDRDCLDG